MRYKILGLGAGGLSGLGGVHEYLFSTLAKKHVLVDVIDTRLSGFWKYRNVLYCFWRLPGVSKYLHPVRTILGEEVSYYRMRTKYYVLKRTEAFENKIKRINAEYDIILQTTWIPAITSSPIKPRCIFVDFTMRMAEREYSQWIRFFSEEDKKRWLKLEIESYRNATMLFTASNHTRDSVINDYGINEEKVVTVYEGANIKELPTFEKDYSNKTVLFVGMDFDRKGGQSLKKAFKEVKKDIPDAKMIVAGCSPSINIPGITVEGYVDHERLLQLYEQASIFTMPSICETLGIVFFEAMAYKTPCIGSTVDAMPEIIEDGKTGLLTHPNDYKQLAEKLIVLLEDENVMKKMGEEGRKRMEKYFTWDLVVDRMTEEFKKILGDEKFI
jgi:glycosyltransferase involved in cell wall biosynthesis